MLDCFEPIIDKKTYKFCVLPIKGSNSEWLKDKWVLRILVQPGKV